MRFSGDVTTIQPKITAWPSPSLTLLRPCVLGATPLKFFYPAFPAWVGPNASFMAAPMERQHDALSWLGSPSKMTVTQLPRTLWADENYPKMREARLTLLDLQASVTELKKICAQP